MLSPAFLRTCAVAAVVVAGSFLLPSPNDASEQSSPGVPERTVRVSGLRAPVEIRRDRWGVPHIYAESQPDLFFAQGYVAAQDRLFQMEMWRRQGEGRLAEVLGPAALDRDRLARLVAYRGDMDAEWRAYAPDTKEIVTAFVAGVNARISDAKDSLPPEFALLGFVPEPWDVTVPLSRATGLSGVGNGNSEVLRAQLVEKLGARRVDELLPADPVRAHDPVSGLDLAGITSASLGGFGSAFADIAYDRLEGSNNWVVNGSRSATGKPILANDPHRVITNPAVRYLTHLVAPGWNVIGAGEPASPGVAIGHNDRIAFGLTVVGMDQMDVYVETLGTCRGVRLGCSRYRGAWVPLRTIIDTIRVRGAAPRIVRLQFTRHGPVVSVDTARSRAVAIRSIHSEPGTASYLASLSLGRARNWEEFQEAMTRWLMPSENMLYADVDGNIGWVAGGIMPRRSWSGLLPVPGDGRYEWDGFVPGMELPRDYNPKTGWIATANHNILPPGYTTPISYEWASRYRIDRVRELVSTPGAKFTVSDFERFQHDDLSKLAQSLVPRLVEAGGRQATTRQAELSLLAGWNHQMSRDQIAPSLFAAWAPAASRRVNARVLAGSSEAAELLASRPDYERLEQYLAGPNGGTPATDSLLLAALDDAVVDLTRRFGSDRAQWRWGTIHVAQFRHRLSSKYDLPAVSRGGDGNTVYATGGGNYRQTSGASFREIIDLANFDNSVVTNVPGQSADPRSPHYSDLLTLWGNDQYFPLVYSRARVDAETRDVLWLVPAVR